MPGRQDPKPSNPSQEEIRAQVGKIISSRLFARSSRLADILKYLVDHSLRGEQVKAIVISAELFGKPYGAEGSAVRAAVGRLRESLANYYANEGTNDSIVIKIPKGSYSAEFLAVRSPSPMAAEVRSAESGAATLVSPQELSSPAFELFIDEAITSEQIHSALGALADYYRACGGVGLIVEFENQTVEVPEHVDA
jgi:hypothetical protein